METEPDEVTVIVISAKGLHGKKPGRHKYSVIFGVGSKKYRTAVVKEPSGNPEWNEESIIHVNSILDQAFFIVTEKEDILGQINIPVSSLQGPPGRLLRSTLQPHKKCANPCGELIYQCYISYRRPVDKEIIPSSPTLSVKSKKGRRGSAFTTLNKKFSRSIHDLLGFGSKDDNIVPKSYSKNALKFRSINSGLDNAGKLPIITSVTPTYGLASGGTRLTIEGRNLGYSKSDIVDLTICECDCAERIEYESSSKIYVTTNKTLPGIGDIILETESGGIGTLRNAFTFCDKLPEEGGSNPFETGPNPFEDEEEDEDMKKVIEECRSSPKIPKSPVKALPPGPLSGLPKVASSGNLQTPTSPISKKHFIKHLRRASEGHCLSQNKAGPVTVPPNNATQDPVLKMKELEAQVERLKTENHLLKQDNRDMKSYIDKLVAKVLLHCPDALETDEKEQNKSG